MRLTKIHWKRFKSPIAFATGSLLGTSAALVFAFLHFVEPTQADDQPQNVVIDSPDATSQFFDQIYSYSGNIGGKQLIQDESGKPLDFNSARILGIQILPQSPSVALVRYRGGEKLITTPPPIYSEHLPVSASAN